MRNFVTKFGKILEICKKFAGNQVNEKGNVPRRGVVPTFSDLEVVALSITAEALSIDSENYLFKRLNTECPGAIPNLITRRQYNQRRKKTMLLGESIRQTIAKAIDGGETVFSIDSKPVKVCQNARANRCQMGKDDIEHAPSWGYCASQNMYNLFSSSSRMGYLFSSISFRLWPKRRSFFSNFQINLSKNLSMSILCYRSVFFCLYHLSESWIL
jgi:hypothetical protein